MIKSWIFDLADYPFEQAPDRFDARAATSRLDWLLDVWTRAESWGYEGILFSEHHFQGGVLSPSPNLLVAAMSARTHRLRLGVLGVVVPMYEPWRIAEEAAMLDHLTHGRLELGLVRGIAPLDLERIGVDPASAQSRFDEAVIIIEKALTCPEFSHQGQYWQFDNLGIVPRPVQQPHPPIWMTSQTPESAAKAGAKGCRLGLGRQPTAAMARIAEAYRHAAKSAGKSFDASQISLRRYVIVADTAERANALADDAIDGLVQRYGGPESLGGRVLASRLDVIVGSPAQVAEEIVAQCREIGAGNFVLTVPSTLSRDATESCYTLFAERIIPSLLVTP